MSYPLILLIAAVLLVGSTLTSRFAARFGFSSLLATLLLGMMLGNGGAYDFDYNYPLSTLRVSEIALSFIIFAGGFDTNVDALKSVVKEGVGMATMGVLFTALTVAGLVHLVLGWSFLYALLLGAIVSSTDAAAVFSILDGNGLQLKHKIGEVLSLESGTNDPMAYFLTLGLTGFIRQTGAETAPEMLLMFVKNMGLGVLTGYLGGLLACYMIKACCLKKGQNPVLIIGSILFIYALNQIVGGSSFLAVYIMGIMLGRAEWNNKLFNVNFFDGFSWLMETMLFLILGLQVYLHDLRVEWLNGVIVSVILMFIARPLGTFLTYLPFRSEGWEKKVFISWVGLRGATPIVFALIPVVYDIPNAMPIFNITFIVVIMSVAFQGNTVAWLSARLGLNEQ